MRTTPIPIEKQDVQKFSSEELRLLTDWGSHKGHKLLIRVKDDVLKRMINDSILDDSKDDLARVELMKEMAYMNHALDFLLDVADRAKKELKSRS